MNEMKAELLYTVDMTIHGLPPSLVTHNSTVFLSNIVSGYHKVVILAEQLAFFIT